MTNDKFTKLELILLHISRYLQEPEQAEELETRPYVYWGEIERYGKLDIDFCVEDLFNEMATCGDDEPEIMEIRDAADEVAVATLKLKKILDKYENKEVKTSESFKTLWDYIDTLKEGSDEWRIAMNLGTKYHRDGKNPDEYIEEIIAKVNDKK